jgi:hypothetical protein
LKIAKGKEIEMLTMALSDYESHAFNNEVKVDEIDRFLQDASASIDPEKAQERLIESLKFIKKLKHNVETLKKELTDEVSLRTSAERSRDMGLTSCMEFQRMFSQHIEELLFMYKKLDITKQTSIDRVKELSLLNENEPFLSAEKIS